MALCVDIAEQCWQGIPLSERANSWLPVAQKKWCSLLPVVCWNRKPTLRPSLLCAGSRELKSGQTAFNLRANGSF